MKNIFVVLLISCLSVLYAYPQKAKVKSASNYYKEPYQQYDKAKEAIDEAVLNEQTKNSEEAWYYRGLIYSSLYKNEKYGSLCVNCLQVAYESYKKSIELDSKSDHALEINALRIPWLVTKVFEQGVENYNAKSYEQALSSFESVLTMMPDDTSSVKNSAYAAEKAGNNEKTKLYYGKLIAMGVKDPDHYISLSNAYRSNNENAKALEVIRSGRKIYPDTLSLMYNEINILLAENNSVEASAVINTGLNKDPNNESLYLVLGNTYDKLANPTDASGNSLPKPASSAEHMAKAIDVYKKGLAINPNNYGLNFNIGAYYFNVAAEMTNAANNIKSENEYVAAKAKANDKFKESQPYLEKAMVTNPKTSEDDISIYNSTLNSLKELYARTNQTEKYNKLVEQINSNK